MKTTKLFSAVVFYAFLYATASSQDISYVNKNDLIKELERNRYDGNLMKINPLNIPSEEDSIFITDSIQGIKSYAGNSQLLFVKDSLRGGFFYRYSGARVVDSGLVFIDSLERKWHRYQVNDYINVCWYGLKAADSDFDNYTLWVNMLNSISRIRSQESTEYFSWKAEFLFPPNEKYYYFSNTLIIDYNLVIRGGAASQKYLQYAKLKFPANTTGLNIRFAEDSLPGVNATYIKDLYISAAAAVMLDSTKHGINSNAPVFIENVTVTGFSGHGINLQGPQGSPPTGSVDLSSIKRCYLTYNYDGLHIGGGDGNACLIEDCNFSLNRRWGLNDLSFLGNTYIANHAASNCSVAGQRTMVCQGGHTYSALRAGSDLKNPGVDAGWENDWHDFGAIGCIWDTSHFIAGHYYEPGGAYAIDNRDIGSQNQRSILLGCYAESDQPPSYVGNKSISIGGVSGNGLYSYSPKIEANEGRIYVNRQGIRSDVGDLKIFGMLNQLGVIVQKENGEGLRMTYDTSYRMGRFLDQYSGESSTLITSNQINPSILSRGLIEGGRLWNINGVYFSHAMDRSRVKFLDLTNEKPSTVSSAEIGDIRLATQRGYYEFEPVDDIIYKVINPSGDGLTKVWTTVKGAAQYLKTTTDTSAVNVETNYYVNRSLKFYVSGSCTDTSGNYYFFKKLFRVISNGTTATLVSIQDLENEEKSSAFSTAGIYLTFSGVHVTSVVHGAIGDWQLFISREKQ